MVLNKAEAFHLSLLELSTRKIKIVNNNNNNNNNNNYYYYYYYYYSMKLASWDFSRMHYQKFNCPSFTARVHSDQLLKLCLKIE